MTPRILAALAAVALAVISLGPVGCSPSSAPKPVEKATFVGNEACAPCHASEFKKHARSRHARSLHVATVTELGALAPKPGPILDSGTALRRDGDRLFLRSASSGEELRLELALGSAKTGITFVGIDGDSVVEGRMSYFPSTQQWYRTPGQERVPAASAGMKHPPADSKRCLGCHSVVAPETPARWEKRFFGIGCEACHGPGSAHVDAAKRKDNDLRIARMKDWGATQLNEACGQCHRSGHMVSNRGLDMTMTNRFQVYGLMESACFRKSGGKVSCISCHDPHDDASKVQKDYEAVCLACHEPSAGKPCPVNPAQKCVSCHMPSRRVFPRGDVPIEMADHLIWTYGKRPRPGE